MFQFFITHYDCPRKQRKIAFYEDIIEKILKDIGLEIENHYEIRFLEIGSDKEHPYKAIPNYSPRKAIQIIKTITAKTIFRKCPIIKKKLWGEELCSKGYFVSK